MIKQAVGFTFMVVGSTYAIAQGDTGTEDASRESVSYFKYYAWEVGSSLFVILTALFVLYLIFRPYHKQYMELVKRTFDHMDRLEGQQEEVISILKKLRGRDEGVEQQVGDASSAQSSDES